MAVYYYKGAQILTPLSIISNEPVFDMTTVSLKTQRAGQGHQRWELSFNVTNEKEDHVDTFLASFQDLETTDTMIMPQLPEVDKQVTVNTNSRSIGAFAAAGVSSVSISRSNNGLVPKGSFIKFSNSDKIYILTADLNLSGTGTVNASIYPNLKKALTTSDSIKFKSDVVLTYHRNIDNQTGITFTDGVLSNIGSISLIEAL